MVLGFYKYPEGNRGIPTGSSKNRDIPFWRWAGTTEIKNLVVIFAQHLFTKTVDRRGDELTTDSSTILVLVTPYSSNICYGLHSFAIAPTAFSGYDL
jgi:hypothetical protein